MKKNLLPTLFLFLIAACTSSVEEKPYGYTNAPFVKSTSELTPEQQSSFDALNTLQVSTDERNHLYSTFAGAQQACLVSDTSFTISQSEFRLVMNQFVERHCTKLTTMKRDQLVTTAVLAQEEYVVSFCSESSNDEAFEDGIPMTGTWVIPNVLGRRDVILIW